MGGKGGEVGVEEEEWEKGSGEEMEGVEEGEEKEEEHRRRYRRNHCIVKMIK